MTPTTPQAVAASVAVARRLGLPADDPVVLAEGYSVRVHLRPAPVVTRVVTQGQVLRGDPLPWLEREVAVAGFLAGSGAPVVSPWSPAGPHLVEGVPVTLWRWFGQLPGTVAQAAFGALLGDLHAALEPWTGDLPVLVGPLTDVASGLAAAGLPVLHRAADVLLPQALSWPRRPLHGDAHTGNLLLTDAGPLWTDFEDVCVGPVEWDLASLTLTDEAVAAYPGAVDHERLAACRDLRRLQVIASLVTDADPDPALLAALVEELEQRY